MCLFVCLFVCLNQPVPTAQGSGLQGPKDPFSTTMGDWDLFYTLEIVEDHQNIDGI